MRLYWRLSFWSTLLLIALASLTPVSHLPTQAFDIWDKAQHAGGFAFLTLLACAAYRMPAWRWCIALGFYGAAIEVAQHWSGWRTGDLFDWLADMTGVVMALAVQQVFRLHSQVSQPDR